MRHKIQFSLMKAKAEFFVEVQMSKGIGMTS
jgi:hypothetical protein